MHTDTRENDPECICDHCEEEDCSKNMLDCISDLESILVDEAYERWRDERND